MSAAAKQAAGPAGRGLADHLYRLLMLAYPAELRREFGEDMIGMFRAQRREAGSNPLRAARIWVLALMDVAVHATLERRDEGRRRSTGGADRGERRAAAGERGDPQQDGPAPRPRGALAAGCRALIDDVHYALRALLRRPRFTAIVGLVVAVGVGTSTAVFGVVDATLLRPLPYANANRLMDLQIHLPEQGFTINAITVESARAWRDQRALFEHVEGYDTDGAVIGGGGEPERVAAAWISPGLLPMLGVAPVRGRGFGDRDGAAGTDPVALISEGLWRRRFGGAGEVLGDDLLLEDGPHTIVGVLPDSFRFPGASTEVWRPMPLAPHPDWEDDDTINAVGLLRPELTRERAQEMADAVSVDLEEVLTYPHVRLSPWEELRAGRETRSSLFMLLGAVGFLVLIASANLANLMLAQTTTRSNEIAVRAALGASRRRVARQIFVESLLLAGFGGALGMLLAMALLRVTLAVMPASIVYRLATGIAVDGRVAVFAAALSLLLGLAMGLLPAAGAARGAVAALRGGAHASASRSHARARAVLVVVEVALSLLLLVGAGLMVNSFARLQRIDPGFDPDNLLLVELRFDTNRYPTEGERLRLADELDTLIEGLPGVAGATIGGDAPPVPGGITFGIVPEAEGMPPAPVDDLVLPYGRVAADYFEVVGIPFVAGGTFAPHGSGAGPAIVINETVAEHFWGDVDPVGRRFRVDADQDWLTVMGVVGDVRAGSPDDPYGSMEVYFPFDPETPSPAYRTMTVRTDDDPMALVEAIKAQVWSLDADQPVEFQRAADVLAGRIEVPRFYLQLIAAFALIAATLAAFGLYGVLAYTVGRRVHEIGIRMALGESQREVLRSVVSGGLLLATVGVALGLAGAAWFSRYLESMLYEISPVDAPTFAATAALMLLVSLLACYFPARRATRVDPVEALRAQ